MSRDIAAGTGRSMVAFAHNRVSSYVIAVISIGSKSAEFRAFWHHANGG
jgi:hypothetical protein